MTFIAVDPGVTGGLAVFGRNGYLHHVDDLTVSSIGSTNQISPTAFKWVIDQWNPTDIIIEDNRAMGQNGSKANYSMGLSMGIIIGVTAGASISLHRLKPQAWQKTLGLNSIPADKRKEAHRHRAIELWPHMAESLKLKKHHNRADAALIGEAWRTTQATATL